MPLDQIAGDSALTAAHVAKDVGMCTAPVILAEMAETGDSLVWRMPDDTLSPFKAQELPRLVSDFTLGLTGSAIQTLSDQGLLASVVPYCQARSAVFLLSSFSLHFMCHATSSQNYAAFDRCRSTLGQTRRKSRPWSTHSPAEAFVRSCVATAPMMLVP